MPNYAVNYNFIFLMPTPTTIATGSTCGGELAGCSLALVSHLAAEQFHGILTHISASRRTDLSVK